MAGRKGPETKLSSKVMDRIRKEYAGEVRKVHADAYGAANEPDIDACILGRCVKIELKVPGKVPTPGQYGRLRAWARAGALAGWVTTLDELDELLVHVGDVGWVNPQLAADERAPIVVELIE